MDRLPFDVFGVIFYHYAAKETIKYPLETLLLVNRLWNDMALGHRHIWGRLSIYVGHYPDSKIWIRRLPRRLERAGDYTPLEIDLRSRFDTISEPSEVDSSPVTCNYKPTIKKMAQICGCSIEARKTGREILRILVGPNGSLCRRWKSLRLCLGHAMSLREDLNYPTPNLTSLYIERTLYDIDFAILPDLSSLQTLRFRRCVLFALPNLETIRDLNLELCPRDTIGEPDLTNLTTATYLEKLTIVWRRSRYSHPPPYLFPDLLPYLTTLSLSGGHLPSNFAKLYLPKLRFLALNLDDISTHQQVLDSSLPFADLIELKMIWPVAPLGLYETLRGLTTKILLSCDNLERIKGDRKCLSVMMKICWEGVNGFSTSKDWIADRRLTFYRADSGNGQKYRGLQGGRTLEDIASLLGVLAPDTSWANMLGQL